jgi:hypothetical protein
MHICVLFKDAHYSRNAVFLPSLGPFKAKTSLNMVMLELFESPRRYPYFDIVVGLAMSHDPESNADGSVAAGRISHARQIKGDDPDKNGYPGLPDWGLGLGLTAPTRKKP